MLKINDKVGINLHGEAAYMDNGEREVIMDKWRTSFWASIEEHNVLGVAFTMLIKQGSAMRNSQTVCM